jgi:hypothetical protein
LAALRLIRPAPGVAFVDAGDDGADAGEGEGHHADQRPVDAGKKIKGKKRHIVVDMVGLLLHAVVHPADIQDRDGGILVLSTMFGLYPFLSKLFADAGYQGPQFRRALAEVLPHLTKGSSRVPIRLGKQGGDWVQVTEGVKVGEKVVTSANFLIDAESNLRAALKGFATPNPPSAPESRP